ncbi:hypothetical protein TD95_000754 [Thielaviopsis punctulata]|uniref:Vps41 beta-propeller domain-containing protein n=1 Tax=Thielaviopsis punctulata TaxID=72032 RepID=A0A0F4ZKU3_9PEZI|nr:hypothetical protein TD95_000754 [Thielaviopsis punctulata]
MPGLLWGTLRRLIDDAPETPATDNHQSVTKEQQDSKDSGDESEENESEEDESEQDLEELEEEEEEEEDQESQGEEEASESGQSDESEEEEPQLKTARLTSKLGPIYRNGDAVSSFLVGGDKMIVATHNGNIHVLQLPSFQSVRVYHAHSASVTSISMSPFPPPLPTLESLSVASAIPAAATATAAAAAAFAGPIRRATSIASTQTSGTASRGPVKLKGAAPIPNIPSNNIYVATSSTDGNVCIQSLMDMKDVQLRNFARPVQAVALSPDYKNDRTYLSGGLAGNLIVTVGGSPGRSTSTTIGTAAATASGWLGSISLAAGYGSGSGRDTILHSGEGAISTIKWSLSGKYVTWLNEFGIKIMRSRLHLDSSEAAADEGWKRIGHIDRPQTEEWDTMASVWKGRVEWIDEQALEAETSMPMASEHRTALGSGAGLGSTNSSAQQTSFVKQNIERLVVGWGNTIWIIHVHAGGVGVGKNVGERIAGRAEIQNVLRMDCIISGLSFFSANSLLVLAFCRPEDEDEQEEPSQTVTTTRQRSGSEPSGGIKRRQNNVPPELRLIDLDSQVEADKVGLIISRYERLSCNDYHLGLLPAARLPTQATARGALEAIAGLGTDMWNVATNPMALFGSAASVTTRTSTDADDATSRISSSAPVDTGTTVGRSLGDIHPNMAKPGLKVFIHSPYDCVLATKRDLADHLGWLLDQKDYQQAWELLDEHPEILNSPYDLGDTSEAVEEANPTADRASAAEGSTATPTNKYLYSSTEKEKRRVGELWIRSVVEAGDWTKAGEICGRVLTTGDRWQKWVWTFAGASKFDDIVDHLPTRIMTPPIPTTCYEVILGHYIQTDKLRVRELLSSWPTELFDIGAITTTLENQLKFRDVRQDSVEAGEAGRDWRIVMACLAKLHEANGRNREALKCHIKLHDADNAFRLIRQGHLADAVVDDIPGFIGLRVLEEEKTMGEVLADEQSHSLDELPQNLEYIREATAEAIALLVDEAHHGLVRPAVVIKQLRDKDLDVYTYFYLRGLWTGAGVCEGSLSPETSPVQQIETKIGPSAGKTADRFALESKSLVDEFADLAVSLFAKFDRPLLLAFLRTSTSYGFEAAVRECEDRRYYDELVFLYSKTGQMKKALFLIIDRLHDVSKAIAFAKEQDDPDLWDDLLNYSMDKPRFIRGLLEQVGTAMDPIRLVRRIPEGLEIDGLRDGLRHMLREHEIMGSISEGVARVLRSEVAGAQRELRAGQRKGVKFNVAGDHGGSLMTMPEGAIKAAKPKPAMDIFGEEKLAAGSDDDNHQHKHELVLPGHCAICRRVFSEVETETLLGYACGHVFHVSHLLEQAGTRVDMDLVTGLGDEGAGYLVGSKVTHARLLRRRVNGGCPVC